MDYRTRIKEVREDRDLTQKQIWTNHKENLD